MGCFKIRNAADERLAQRTHRWYDPYHKIFLGDDTRYAEGPFYVIQARITSRVDYFSDRAGHASFVS